MSHIKHLLPLSLKHVTNKREEIVSKKVQPEVGIEGPGQFIKNGHSVEPVHKYDIHHQWHLMIAHRISKHIDRHDEQLQEKDVQVVLETMELVKDNKELHQKDDPIPQAHALEQKWFCWVPMQPFSGVQFEYYWDDSNVKDPTKFNRSYPVDQRPLWFVKWWHSDRASNMVYYRLVGYED